MLASLVGNYVLMMKTDDALSPVLSHGRFTACLKSWEKSTHCCSHNLQCPSNCMLSVCGSCSLGKLTASTRPDMHYNVAT